MDFSALLRNKSIIKFFSIKQVLPNSPGDRSPIFLAIYSLPALYIFD